MLENPLGSQKRLVMVTTEKIILLRSTSPFKNQSKSTAEQHANKTLIRNPQNLSFLHNEMNFCYPPYFFSTKM